MQRIGISGLEQTLMEQQWMLATMQCMTNHSLISGMFRYTYYSTS
jgi:hypothetical protein